jgi:hypothetical protein
LSVYFSPPARGGGGGACGRTGDDHAGDNRESKATNAHRVFLLGSARCDHSLSGEKSRKSFAIYEVGAPGSGGTSSL